MAIECGVDEAGRGPLAGPVTASAVILPDDFPTPSLDDSKRLTAIQRAAQACLIKEKAVAWAIGWASHGEIDRINILAATLLAMTRAISYLAVTPDHIIVDGLHVPPVAYPITALVKADSTVPAVMAASILAKTARDEWMTQYSLIDPGYGYERHKGYPTQFHRERIRELGPSPIHRLSFRLLVDAASSPLCDLE